MSKMTVIQLLNKIANGEEAPKKIKFEDYIYEYNVEEEDYYNEKYCEGILDRIALFSQLNDEVEIIEDAPEEEKKIPEKIKVPEIDDIKNSRICHIEYKINEIIDCLEHFKSKGDE